VLRLPDELRGAFKEPFGPVYTDTERLLEAVDEAAASGNREAPPLVAVGDVVSHHLLTSGRQPDVMVIDGKTERAAVDKAVAETLAEAAAEVDSSTHRVENPPAELSEPLLVALREALDSTEPVVIRVDGEEDLATLPSLVAAPLGASVIYGQPGEGMVHVAVTDDQTAAARSLLARFDGDSEAAFELLGSRRQ